MNKGIIIFLNGVSSAGKTTLSKAIQDKLQTPYYRICCDEFMHMTPPQILHDDFDNQLLVTQGIMHEVIRLFSDKGYCVVVDDVVLDLPEKMIGSMNTRLCLKTIQSCWFMSFVLCMN